MGGFSANFNTDVNTGEARTITDRTRNFLNSNYSTNQSGSNIPVWKRRKNWMQGYLSDTLGDPRAGYEHYNRPLSRLGEWWKGYEDAYGRIYDATENYRSDWNTTFDDNKYLLDTEPIQQEWRDYLDRIQGYYGNAYDNLMNPETGFYDKEAYDLWGDLAKGDNQAQGIQDWFGQSTMGQYLEDQANENFWRQAQLGGQTYNPQDVQEYISSRIVAPEAQTAFGNLERYAQLQHATALDLEKWYAEAIAQGDTIAQQEIADLMNQYNQQLWQVNLAQGMGDANLRYLLEGQLPATKVMDFTNQKLAHLDAQRTMKMLHYDKNMYANYLANVGLPNAYDSFLWESGMYQQALQNQQSALNAAMATELAGAGLGALGSIAGAI